METINIISDSNLYPQKEIKLHLTYNDNLTLKELADALDLINKAINDINRKNGISNSVIGKRYAAKVSKVETGSIVLYIVTEIVVPIALSVFANFIFDRLKKLGAKKAKDQINQLNGYPIIIKVNGANNEIEVHIEKPDNY